MKEVVLDTETTGISVRDGHRIVEIGCIEIENLVSTLLQVFLETGGFRDGLAGILVLEGIGVTGIGHTSGSNLGFLGEQGNLGVGGGHGSSEGTGRGHKGEKSKNLGL